ncbi:MAG: tripartite tricarboxylate transporter substrate binding protein [Burkholderiales bacterium]|nr:tripartite tricarboxylate transporter substrate binding protein [Burkholderiales bacterium]
MMRLAAGMISAMVLAGAAGAARAQADWPAKPIRLVIGFPPGGALDNLARSLAPPMGRALGQSITIENRPGAGQSLAAEVVAKAEPDGYTVGLVDSGPLTVSPHLKAQGFDPAKSFVHIGTVAKLPLVLAASTASGLSTLQDVARAARDKPGALSYASAGPASMHNLTGEYLKGLLKVDITHVPYKGVSQILPDVIAGRVPLMFGGVSGTVGFIRDKQIRAIGVTSARRSVPLPDVPTLAEQGLPGFESVGWVGLSGPAGLPATVTTRLGNALREALKDRALYQQEVARGGNELLAGTAEEHAALFAADLARWGRVVKEQGIRAD